MANRDMIRRARWNPRGIPVATPTRSVPASAAANAPTGGASPNKSADPCWGGNLTPADYEPTLGYQLDIIREYPGVTENPNTGATWAYDPALLGTRRLALSLKSYDTGGGIQYCVDGPGRATTAGTWSANVGTLTLGTAVNVQIGKRVTLSGCTPAAWNSQWTVTAASPSTTAATTLTLTMVIADPGPITVQGTCKANGITKGDFDTEIDRWGDYLAAFNQKFSWTYHHEPDNLPGSFTEYPWDNIDNATPVDWRTASSYIKTRVANRGVTKGWFGACIKGVTARNNPTTLNGFIDSSHEFLALDSYSATTTNSFTNLFLDGANYASDHGLGFCVWETNTQSPMTDAQQGTWWSTVASQAQTLGVWECCTFIGSGNTLSISGEPVKFSNWKTQGADSYFN